MKKRLTASVLAMVLAFSCLPTAFAAEVDSGVTNTTQSAISSLYAETPSQSGTFTVGSAKGSNVYQPQILSEAEHKKFVASGDWETVTYSKNYSEEVTLSDENGGISTTYKPSSFTSYGAQLSNLRYQASGSSTKVAVGAAMKKMYDRYKADILKGTSGAVFTYNETSLRNLGVTFSIPSSYTNTQARALAIDCGWVVYRSLDMDRPEMFYSNGYCSMGYSRSGSTLTVYLIPLFRPGFTSLSQRKSLKTQLDNKVAEIVKGANAYSRAYDKLKYFDNWLCTHNTYNDDAVENQNYIDYTSGAPWSSVSAILSSSNSSVAGPVCEGYSRALQLLCSKVGIESTNVVSDSGWHMWNNVRYGNYWTGIDVTWNDSSGTKNYFCRQVNNTSGHVLDDADFYTWFKYPSLSVISSSSILPYYDVSSTYWGRKFIQNVYDKNYMVGMDCVTFAPNTKVTREQFVQIMYSMAGSPSVSYTAKFSDVPKGKWYTNAVTWAAKNGVVSGYPDGTFGIGKQIKREDLALILYNYRNKPAAASVDLNARFVDANMISSYAYTAINWAVATGVMSGDDKGRLTPRGTATRAQSATMITQFE